MDLKQLRYFVCVLEQGSFTRASRLLDVAQPALSRQVRLLEVELRHTLLTRTGRGVVATDAGVQFLQHARRILQQVEIAEEDMARAHGALNGHVTLGVPPSLSKLITVPLISEFRARFPQATLSISDGLSVSMQEWLLSGRLDIALLHKPQPSPDIDTIPVMREELFLITATRDNVRTDPVTLAQVAGLPLVIPRKPHEIRMLVEARMAEIGCRPSIMLEVDGVPAILDVLSGGAGWAVLPLYAVSVYAKSGDYVFRRINPGLESMLAIATSSRRAVTPTQQATLALTREVCKLVLLPRIQEQIDQMLSTMRGPPDPDPARRPISSTLL